MLITLRVFKTPLLPTSQDFLSSELVHPTANTTIPDFPTKPGDIQNMTDEKLNTVLEQLGLSTEGPKAAKQRRLRFNIGLRAAPA